MVLTTDVFRNANLKIETQSIKKIILLKQQKCKMKSNDYSNYIDFVLDKMYTFLKRNIGEFIDDSILGNSLLEDRTNIDIKSATSSYDNVSRKSKKVSILGYFITKCFKRWKLNERLKNSNTPINCFAGASTKDMGYYSQPPLAEMVMINVSTNDFSSNCLLKKTANDIVNLATVIEKEIQSENATY